MNGHKAHTVFTKTGISGGFYVRMVFFHALNSAQKGGKTMAPGFLKVRGLLYKKPKVSKAKLPVFKGTHYLRIRSKAIEPLDYGICTFCSGGVPQVGKK